MKEISIRLHDQRMRVLKDETTTLRMQLRGDAPGGSIGGGTLGGGGFANSIEQAGLVDEFDRVQAQYDILTLQAELKQMIVENSLLKERTMELQERFRRVEIKRENFIGELEGKVAIAEQKVENVENRQARLKKSERDLKNAEGQNETLKTEIEFLTT